jgi:DHA2 family multidrug resistance protein
MRDLSYQLVDNLRQQHAAALAFFDVFWVFAVVAALLIPLVLLMRRSVAQKGAHLAAE